MFPFLSIFGLIDLPLYSTLFMAGFFIVAFALRPAAKRFGLQTMDGFCGHLFAGIGLVIGAKAMYFFTKVPWVVTHWSHFVSAWKADWMYTVGYLFGGLVFYGGLIGGVLGIIIYCKAFKVRFAPYMEFYAPAIPFMHAFGRIGCFCAGCCYGIEYHGPLAVQFPYNELVPELNAVPRFPVQLFEAGLNFLMAGILFFLYKKVKTKRGQLLGIYICYYTVARFCLEFLRGDKIRGTVGWISTSQVISFLLIPIGLFLLFGGAEKLLVRREKI